MRYGMMIAAMAFALAMPAHAKDKTASRAPVQVMIVGTFHMANPGKDMHDTTAPDVLMPEYQAQLGAIANNLARFHPTLVDVEWPDALVQKRYAAYLKGTLKPSHDEVVQIGFRLAKRAGVRAVQGIDSGGDFPYEPLEAYAKAHGQQNILKDANDQMAAVVQHENRLLREKGIAALLRQCIEQSPGFKLVEANDYL